VLKEANKIAELTAAVSPECRSDSHFAVVDPLTVGPRGPEGPSGATGGRICTV